MKGSTIIFFLMFTGSRVSGQNDHSDLMKFLHCNADPHQLVTADVHFSYYPQHDSKVPIDTMTIQLQVQGNNFHYRMNDHEYLRNGKYCVTVNYADHLLLIKTAGNEILPVFQLQQLDSLISNQFMKVQSLGNVEDETGYNVVLSKGVIKKFDIWFRHEDSLLHKINLYYGETKYDNEIYSPRVEIEYGNMKSEKVAGTASLFSERKFFSTTGKNLRLADAFMNYNVINNIR